LQETTSSILIRKLRHGLSAEEIDKAAKSLPQKWKKLLIQEEAAPILNLENCGAHGFSGVTPKNY